MRPSGCRIGERHSCEDEVLELFMPIARVDPSTIIRNGEEVEVSPVLHEHVMTFFQSEPDPLKIERCMRHVQSHISTPPFLSSSRSLRPVQCQ